MRCIVDGLTSWPRVAAAAIWRLLAVDLGRGVVDQELWSIYLDLVDDSPVRRLRWSVGKALPSHSQATLKLVDVLVRRGGAAAAVTAAELPCAPLPDGKTRTGKEARDWSARIDAVRRIHPDAAELLTLGGYRG